MRNTIRTTAVALFVLAGAVACSDRPDDAAARAPEPRPVSESLDAAERTAARAEALPVAEIVTVWKSPTCGCCSNWVDHMRAAGFEVETHDVDDLSAIKAEHGIGLSHQSCHTATVGDYVLEGHVPADLVRKMLEERPGIAGLAVPGMPRGSPGMEMPDGTKDEYDVLALHEDGGSEVYARR